MNQKNSVAQTPKFVRVVLTSDKTHVTDRLPTYVMGELECVHV